MTDLDAYSNVLYSPPNTYITSNIANIRPSSFSFPATCLDVDEDQINQIVKLKLEQFANRIYDILKELDRIEISREEWQALLADKE